MHSGRGLGVLLFLAACASEPPGGPDATTSTTISTTTSSTTPPSTTTASPTTSTAAAGNRPPRVDIEGGGSCHPSATGSVPGAMPCTVSLRAVASDPDGDDVTLEWSGCASGTRPDAECTIPSPGVFTARVVARDGRGGVAEASRASEGVNAPPVVRFGGSGRPPDPAPSNEFFPIAGAQPEDPDGDEDPNVVCGTVALTVSGPCSAGLAPCGGAGDAFDVDITTKTGPGTCVVEATARDSWGAVGRDRLEFRVSPP